jgi:hypothetical protein
MSKVEAQTERLSQVADRAVSQTSPEEHTADAKSLAELVSHLNAMISVFTIERKRDSE